MSLTAPQQIFETIKRSNRPLICVPSGAGIDQYATAIGLGIFLNKLEKQPTIVAADGSLPKNLAFLSGQHIIQPRLENLRQFVIELDAKKTKVNELTYEMRDDKLFVYLSPKQGFWDAHDVKTSSSGYRHDLIICIGSPDFESCAHLYTENTDFFFRTPIINIDHTPENEHYGQINIIDLTASACGEVCHDLIESIEPGLMDANIATAFLTGMIAKTKSFRSKNVTPKTLQTASKLMAKGAERDLIIQHLYRTRSVPTLRLWGRALARLKTEASVHLVWTLLSQQDFLHAGAEEKDLHGVIDELLSSTPNAHTVILFYENTHHDICVIVHTERPLDAITLCTPFKAAGTREEVRFTLSGKPIVEAEKNVIEHVKSTLKIA